MQQSGKHTRLNRVSPQLSPARIQADQSQSTSTYLPTSCLACPPAPSCTLYIPLQSYQSLMGSATPVYTQELGIPCGSYVRSRKSILQPQLDPDEVAAHPFPSPPDTPGSYCSAKTDPSTLIYAGRLHAQVLAANMRSMMPVLMAYGYGQEDLESLIEDCVNMVSRLDTSFSDAADVIAV
jgi:hypothetical protein